MGLILRKSSDAQNCRGRFRCAHSVTHSDLIFSSLGEVEKRSQALLEKKNATGFLDKSKDAQEVVNLVEELRSAIVYYQVSANHTS